MADGFTQLFPHGQMPGSLELAFVGDSVYDLYVRSALVKKRGRVNELNRAAVGKVNAHAQSESLKRLRPLLTEDEQSIVRRAQNTRQTATKNADPQEYHLATALEALLGYLYLTGQRERLRELLKLATEMEGSIDAV